MSIENLKNKTEKEFYFQGKIHTYNTFKSLELVKTYSESSHYDRKLYKNKDTNQMYLYEFNEYLAFSDRGDFMDEFYVVVFNEQDADQLSSSRSIIRKPYVHIDNNFSVNVYE